MHKGELRVMLRVGRSSGPRGRIGFIHHLLVKPVAVEQSQQPAVTRSPHDVFVAPKKDIAPIAAVSDDIAEKTERHAPKSPKPVHITFDPDEAVFLERLKKSIGCKSMKEAATRCVRIAMAAHGAI